MKKILAFLLVFGVISFTVPSLVNAGIWIRCNICGGTGRCLLCGGTGFTTIGVNENGYPITGSCTSCFGSGKCQTCGGRGEVQHR